MTITSQIRDLALLSLLFITIGCGPSSAHREFAKKVQETKDKYQASEIKKVALEFFSHYVATNQSANVPNKISSLPIFKDDGTYIRVMLFDGEPSKAGAAFVAGGGFGHWGLVVYPAVATECDITNFRGKVTLWADGVYFWIED